MTLTRIHAAPAMRMPTRSQTTPIRTAPRRRGSRGLTLTELIIGIAVLTLASAVAGPQFQQWGRNTRVITHTADLQSALAYARSEAQRRGIRVSVCASSSTAACSTSPVWASGWIVFVDNVHIAGNVAGEIDGADVVLRVGEAASGSVIATTGNVGAWVSYSPQGLVRTVGAPANGGFTVCQAPHGRRIAVSPVGLINVSTETCS